MAQFFPGDDTTETVIETFDDGATGAYGRSPSLYVRAVPWDTFWHSNRTGETKFVIAHQPGFIHDAIAATNARAVSSPDVAAAYRPASMYAVRGVSRSNVRATMEADLYRDSGTITDQFGNAGFYGVFVRLHGGVITNADTRTEYLGDLGTQDATNSLKGYGFYVTAREGQGVRYALVKLRTDDALGPEILIQRTEADFWPYGIFDAINGRYGPTGIRLECETVAGDAVLTAFLRDHKNGGAWTQISSFVDTSSPFNVAGRCGFSLPQIGNNGKPVLDPDYAIAGAVASSFEIVDITGSDILFFRDEFQRRNRQQARSWGTGAGSAGLGGTFDEPVWTSVRDPHYAFANQYHGDLVAADISGSEFFDILRSDGSNRAEAGGTRDPGSMVSCQTYDANQHVKADFNLTDQPAKRATVGFVLRYTDAVTPPQYLGGVGVRGYEVRINYDGVSTFTAEVWGAEGGVAPVLLANATLGGLSHGTEFEIDAEVQNISGTGGSRVAVGVKIDTVFVAFAAVASGVSIISDYVVDDRAVAIADGVGRALLYDSPAGTPRPLATYNNLTALPLSTISIGNNSEQENTDLYASVVVAGETDGATGVLALEQTWPEREESIYRQGRQLLRSGQAVVRAKDRRGRRTWGLEAAQMTTADREALETFIDDREGPTVPFRWTTGDGEEVVASFSRLPDLSLRQDLPFTESAIVEITERFGPNFETVEANWEAINQALVDSEGVPAYYSQHIRADGFVYDRASDGSPQGGTTDTTRDFKIVFPSANGLGSFEVGTSGSAVEGTHYTISPTSFQVGVGETEKTTTVTVLDPGLYFTEKSLTLTITNASGLTTGDASELRLFFYATPGATVGDPPALDFNATGTTSSTDGDFIEYTAQVDQHRSDDMGPRVSGERTKVFVRAVASGGLTEGVDYTTNLIGRVERGVTNTGQTGGIHPSVTLRPYSGGDPIIGETVDLFIDHEPVDASEENFWGWTDDWRHEFGNGTLAFNLKAETLFPGDPTSHANGGGSNQDSQDKRFGTDIVTQGQAGVTGPKIETPWGTEVQCVLQSEAIKSDWYIRESFETSEYGGTLERKLTWDTWVLFWTYVDEIDTGDWEERNCRFITLNARNRTPGNLEIGAHFQRVEPNEADSEVDKDFANNTWTLYNGGATTSTPVATDAGKWGLWKRERLHPDSKVGVEEETDANGQNHTRLWVLAKVDGTYTAETNDAPNVVYQGSATSTESPTTHLKDTAVNFNRYQVKVGSIIRNVTAGVSDEVLEIISSDTVRTRFGPWTLDDVYRVSQKEPGQSFSRSATGGSSTTLDDTLINFVKISVSPGDLVHNDTDGSSAVVTSVTATQLTFSGGLAGGLDNAFAAGDTYKVYVNNDGRATSADGSPGINLVDTNASFIVDRVGRFDEITNTTTGAVGSIDSIDSDTGITLTSDGLQGGSRDTWEVTDNYTIAHRAVAPVEGWAGNAIYRYGFFNGGDARNGQTSSSTRSGGKEGVRKTGAAAWGPGYVTDALDTELLLDPGTDDRPCPIVGPPDPDATTPKNDGPGRHWPRDGFWREPRGNATKLSTGQLRWRLTIG